MVAGTQSLHLVPFRFDEVNEAPLEPGLYAWYHQIQISNADVQSLVSSLAGRDQALRMDLVRRFLFEHIFGPYREADYNVELTGKLKPEYRGTLPHQPKLSEHLLKLATEQPEELASLRMILQRVIPYFASPIYIGIATKSLRQRLTSHRNLISHYREREPAEPMNLEDEDHSFAYEAVCVRRLVPMELLVYAMPLAVTDKVTKSAEYILNRINYPLCGRN